uniref:Reverse transcriptase Ty1/copia-type domain-containing protein n=1 Tax=Peronospora matthiolae TaxID=2874970 RepID=A0AAV1TSY5_9STRA
MCAFVLMLGLRTIVVGVYVDNLLTTKTDEGLLNQSSKDLASLELKDLGPVEDFFFKMRISFNMEVGHKVDQEHAITEMLQQNGLEKANAVRAPIADESSLESASEK